MSRLDPLSSIETRALGKAYRLYRRPARRLLEWATLGRVRGHEEHWGLRGLDLELPPGRTLGVIGRNGSGKSTLLRVLAGASEPSEGAYRVRGRVSSLLDLGAGFHPLATGRENVLGTAFLWGFRRDEIRSRLDEIVEFSELGSAIDDPVRTYSSGMAVRLGFALATASQPDVLLLDEVFAVGDVAFQKKCIDRIFEIKRSGRTIVLVTHSVYDVRLLCDEALWLERGRMRGHGDPLEVTGAYQASLEDRTRPEAPAADARLPHLVSVEVLHGGLPVQAVESGASVELAIEWANPTERPVHLGVGFLRSDTVLAFGVATYAAGAPLEAARARSTLELARLALLPGKYLVVVWLLDEHGVHRWHQWPGSELVVHGASRDYGVYAPARAWRHERLDAGARLRTGRKESPKSGTGPADRRAPLPPSDP